MKSYTQDYVELFPPKADLRHWGALSFSSLVSIKTFLFHLVHISYHWKYLINISASGVFAISVTW